ncbi:MAG: helix-turn-helix domain-containing protein [Syntrophus sp. (in: bacteria)]
MMSEKEYLNEKEVSQLIGRALSTLRNDRFNRRGLPYHKYGKSVRYSKADILKILEKCRVNTDSF